MQTAIVLLNFNSFQDTDECIESILASKAKAYEIVVVDNASHDSSYVELSEKYKANEKVVFITSDVNLGFSGGCNLGIKYAMDKNFPYVLLLNNDTLVTEDFLDPMLNVAETNTNVGIVGGKTLFEDDRKSIWDAGGFISKGSYRGIRRREGDEGIDTSGEVGFITCCLALVRREVFEKIGLLPEAYFFGSEEWDFSLRTKRAGFSLWYTPACEIYHKVGRSHDHTSATMLYNTYRNRILFVKRNFNFFIYVFFLHAFVGGKLVQRILGKGQLRPFSIGKSITLLWRTYWDSIRFNKVTKSHWAKV